MPYLNLDVDYFDHPKTLRMVGLLGPGGAEVPIRLWAKAGKFYAKDGALKGYSSTEIEGLIGWRGEAGKAIDALMRVGYLERKNNGFVVHDWATHQGHIWALKVRNEKTARKRWKELKNGSKGKKNKPSVDEKQGSTTGIRHVYQEGHPGIPQPNQPTKPSKPAIPTLKDVTEAASISIRMPWGESRGVPVVDLEPSYCQWLLENKLDAVRATKKMAGLEIAIREVASRKSGEMTPAQAKAAKETA